MSGVAPYPPPEQRAAEFEDAARLAGGELVVLGSSVEGREIRAVRLGAPDGPKLLVVANIHGPEWISSRVALGVLRATGSGDWAELTGRCTLWVVPCLNPDGYARTHAAGGVGSLAHLRANANGVDLNRNFPLPPGAKRRPVPGAGSDRPGDATYRGVAPGSEPEVRALMELAQRERFHAAVGLHSFSGVLIPARVTDRPAYATYRRLCSAFAEAQPATRYRRIANRLVDAWTGEQEDWLHHHVGCWAVTVESFSVGASFSQHLRAPSLFWRFNPRDPAHWVRNDVAGIAGFFGAALNEAPPESGAPAPR